MSRVHWFPDPRVGGKGAKENGSTGRPTGTRPKLLDDDFLVNQTSEPLLLLLSWLRQMHRHFMEVLAPLEESREAYMRKETIDGLTVGYLV
jgi:hypothetical protein